MKPTEIRGLAKATCAWLAYKQITGFEGALGEAMLAIPISEYLKSSRFDAKENPANSETLKRSTNWRLESEVLYSNPALGGFDEFPELSCDFAGIPTYGKEIRFILETKYLKAEARLRSREIAADFIRLSLPTKDQLKRYFLLAGRSEYFKPEAGDFLSQHNLFTLEEGGGRYFKPREEIQRPGFEKRFSRLHLALSSNPEHVPERVYIQCGADEEFPVGDAGAFRVMIWSVGRSKVSAEQGLSEED